MKEDGKRQGVNFTNILRAPFSYESLLSSFSVDTLRFDFFWRKDIGAKAARKTLVKLTTCRHSPHVATGDLNVATDSC